MMNSTTSSSLHEKSLFWIEGLGIATVGLIGLGVNIFAIWRLSCGLKKPDRHCFHHLLLCLSICDLTHIIFNIICFSMPQLSEVYRTHVLLYAIPFLIPLAQMSLMCSSLTTVALTVERYISICWPFLRYRFDIKSWYYIATVITFSVIYNTPRFFEWMTYSEAIERPCLSALIQQAQMAEPEYVDPALNFSFPMPDMNVLNALDDEALEQIIKANYEDVEYSEVYVDPTTFQQELETEATTLLDMAADSNCTETIWNVTLVPRSLRKNHTYVLVYINWMNFIVNLMLPLGVLLSMNLAIYKGMQRLRGGPPVSNGSTKTTPANGRKLAATTASGTGPLTRKIDPENPTSIQAAATMNREDIEERERDARFTRASILMVLAFGLCHTPRLITNTVEMFSDRAELPHWFEVLVCVNHLLVTINSSFNFLIFLMSSKHKRRSSTSSIVTCQAPVRKSSSVQTNQTNPNSLPGDRSQQCSSNGPPRAVPSSAGDPNVIQIELRLLSNARNGSLPPAVSV